MFKLFCEHKYKIIGESSKKVYIGQVTGYIKLNQKEKLYCPKCKKIKWVTKEESKIILAKQKADEEYRLK